MGNQDTRLAAEVVALINSKQSELTEKLGGAGLGGRARGGFDNLTEGEANQITYDDNTVTVMPKEYTTGRGALGGSTTDTTTKKNTSDDGGSVPSGRR